MVAKRMRAAYHAESALAAQAQLETLAGELDRTHPGAAASLQEGLPETLTVLGLGVAPTLARTLRSTNCVESMIGICRTHSRNVKRWRDGQMALRWCAAGMVEAGTSSAGSTATSVSEPCEPHSNGMSQPKTSQSTSTITPATPPDDHRTAAENLRSSGHPRLEGCGQRVVRGLDLRNVRVTATRY